MLSALEDVDKRPKGTLGHLKRDRIDIDDISAAIAYAERRTSQSTRANGLLRSCRVVQALRTALMRHEDGKYFKRRRASIAYMESTVVYRHSDFL